MGLTERADGLWTIDAPLRVGGLALGTRTTAIRLRSGGLVLHSPGPLGDARRAAIEKQGAVRALIAPNALHHLYLAENAAAFPEAEVFVSPGVVPKRKDVEGMSELSAQAPELWTGELEQIAVDGAPRMDEIAFLHPASRTLLLADLCFNFREVPGFFTRSFLRVNNAYGRFGPSRLMRGMIKDKAALRATLERILAWDFDRVIVTHGAVLESGGREALRSAFEGIC
jgi:hypothetical protein